MYHKKTSQKAVSKAKQKQLVKSKVPSIKYPYFAKIFNFFVVKLQLLRKSSDFLFLAGVTNITLVLRFMISNKFYYFQTAKVVNSKDVSC